VNLTFTSANSRFYTTDTRFYTTNTYPACNDYVIIGMAMTMITDKSITRRQTKFPRRPTSSGRKSQKKFMINSNRVRRVNREQCSPDPPTDKLRDNLAVRKTAQTTIRGTIVVLGLDAKDGLT